MAYQIEKIDGAYPIVYVRGFAGSNGAREDTFYDAYYGFAETSVEMRQVAPRRPEAPDTPWYVEPEVFEGQLIRFLKEEGYTDAANGGLDLSLRNANVNPTRCLWISRFYDADVLQGRARDIVEHAEELYNLICRRIPTALRSLKDDGGQPIVDLGAEDADYKVILVAHSMGGLVCRCLLQNILPAKGEDPRRWVHRLVTIATPHGGIEAGAVPDFLEDLVLGQANAFGTAIFREERMRDYLCLPQEADVRSLKSQWELSGGQWKRNKQKSASDAPIFPPEHCLCLIGSDHNSYTVAGGAARAAIGSHSDGLVKQDRAFIQGAYTANVHRAHSGRRGIVNSFESYQNVRRFLFGDTRFALTLTDIELKTVAPPEGETEFYDIEYALSIRGTNVYLHQRRQNPCENALRFERGSGGTLIDHDGNTEITEIPLHIGFMNTRLRRRDTPRYSHFAFAMRVAQHRVRSGWLWDQEYPERAIYSETLEVRVGNDTEEAPLRLQYRWLSDTTNVADPASWHMAAVEGQSGMFELQLRESPTFGGRLRIQAGSWPETNS